MAGRSGTRGPRVLARSRDALRTGALPSRGRRVLLTAAGWNELLALPFKHRQEAVVVADVIRCVVGQRGEDDQYSVRAVPILGTPGHRRHVKPHVRAVEQELSTECT